MLAKPQWSVSVGSVSVATRRENRGPGARPAFGGTRSKPCLAGRASPSYARDLAPVDEPRGEAVEVHTGTGPSGQRSGVDDGQGRVEVAIAVPQAVKRHGVLSILGASPLISVGAVCERVDELFAALTRTDPQIVLLDAELMATSAGSLLEVCGRLLDEHPGVGLVVFSAGLTQTMMLELVRLGVSGHLHYDVSSAELTDAVLAACSGHSALDVRSVGSLVHAVRADGMDSGQLLTAQHRLILQLAAEGRSDQEIAKRLIVSVSTVKQQFARIRRALDAIDRTNAVYIATKRGWL